VSDPAQVDGTPGVTVEVEWRGQTLALPSTIDDCDIEVLEAFEAGKAVGFVRALLGETQWARLRATGLKVRDLNELGDAIAKALGFAGTGE